MNLSRRSILALAGAGAALAQTPAAPSSAGPAAPTDPLENARAENRRGAETLAKFEILMSTEPAFIFRA